MPRVILQRRPDAAFSFRLSVARLLRQIIFPAEVIFTFDFSLLLPDAARYPPLFSVLPMRPPSSRRPDIFHAAA